MDRELDDKLVAEFPNLYRDRHGSPSATCMCWGFEVSNGWFELIYDLSNKLEALILEMPDAERKNCKASQTKEKFGGLRFSMDGETEAMSALIDEAEALSYHICEECGAAGERRGGHYIKVACDKHANNQLGVGAPKKVSLEEIRLLIKDKSSKQNTE